MKTYRDFDIDLPTGASGEQVRVTCPRCTPGRTAKNQNERDLSVNVNKGVWQCHHCQETGDIKRGWHSDTPEKEPEPKYERPSYQPLDLPAGMVDWFKKRGISAGALKIGSVGYQPSEHSRAGAMTFPRYKNGQVVAVKYRTHDKKMWQSKNPEPCFYNRDNALRAGGDTLIITEGEIDALSFIEAGFSAVVSVPDGAPGPNAKSLDRKFKFLEDGTVEQFQKYILAVDSDEPGKALEDQLAERLGRHCCWRVHYPGGAKDANDLIAKQGPDALQRVIDKAQPIPIDGLYTVSDVRDAVHELYAVGLQRGDSPGWQDVQQLYTVRPCEMTIVTGMPGSGKSTWLDAMLVNLNRESGWKFAFCSPENWPVQRHIASLIEKITGSPFSASHPDCPRVKKDAVDQALDTIDSNFFFTQLQDDQMSIGYILEVMQAAISRYGVQGIVLDPWNELEYHRPANMTETEYVSESLGKIRRFARLNNVHVWIVAHPTKLKKDDKTGKYPVPRLYDISGSAHFFNKADNGIAVHRPDYKSDRVQIHVQKIRFKEVGQMGMAELKFIRSNGTYMDFTDDEKQGLKQKTGTALDDIPF